MIIGEVVSTVVSTAKSDRLPHHQLLVVRPEKEFGKPENSVIALNTVQAGVGDRVLVMGEGSGARQALEMGNAPVPAQMVIVGIVDDVQTSG